MSEWAPKRFYKDATVEAEDGGFAVRLDGRPVRTPGKRAIVMPTQEMAEAVASEWRAQEDRIDPTTMPWLRSVNSAIDKVAFQRSDVIDHLIGYAGTDLLCYRADGPDELIARQATTWDPILDWMRQRYDVAYRVTTGVMPVEQASQTTARLKGAMEPMTEFHLTGFHDLVGLSGSYALALAAIEDALPIEDLWAASRIDEDWQIEQWGEDEEAAQAAAVKRAAFVHAHRFFRAA